MGGALAHSKLSPAEYNRQKEQTKGSLWCERKKCQRKRNQRENINEKDRRRKTKISLDETVSVRLSVSQLDIYSKKKDIKICKF